MSISCSAYKFSKLGRHPHPIPTEDREYNMLGEGGFGRVYDVGNRAVKSQKVVNEEGERVGEEAMKTCYAGEKGVGPFFYDAFISGEGKDEELVISMEKLDVSLAEAFKIKGVDWNSLDNALTRLIILAENRKVCHDDIHTNNVMLKFRSGSDTTFAKAYLVDWGGESSARKSCKLDTFMWDYLDMEDFKNHLTLTIKTLEEIKNWRKRKMRNKMRKQQG